ncbi:hypothetical protein [Methylobacterium sp. 37f]|uniref:hypothetical protein n=1 Tax=Methylobacterium sp. 37f TaxID=2817058 RepID=UPI001FFD0CB7|nr:hypothetical protein [Methylobacterium sp. 37f]MCK2056992.1 hypothetical protein [Methylobacterium sp. 37f]
MSSTDTVSFAGEIRRTAAALGRSPTDEQVTNLESLIRDRSYIDQDAGRVLMNDGTDVAAFIGRETNDFPLVVADAPAAPDGWVKVALGTGTSWRKAGDPMTAILQGLRASDDAALARHVAAIMNPWLTGQINRTNQVLLTKSDPVRAARFKAEAAAK